MRLMFTTAAAAVLVTVLAAAPAEAYEMCGSSSSDPCVTYTAWSSSPDVTKQATAAAAATYSQLYNNVNSLMEFQHNLSRGMVKGWR